MPYDERWLADLLAKGQVRLAGSGVPGDRALHRSDTPAIARPHLSERAFMQAVLRLAKDAGWTFAYHTHNSRRSPVGFPDLILAHRNALHERGWPIWAVELKTDTGEVTPAQQAWLDALAGSRNVVSAVWRPSMWEEIVEQLRG